MLRHHKFNRRSGRIYHPSISFLMREEADADSTPKRRTQEPTAIRNVWQRQVKATFHSTSNLIRPPYFRGSAVDHEMYNDTRLKPPAMPMLRLVCRLFATLSVSLALSPPAHAVETLRVLAWLDFWSVTRREKNQRLAENWLKPVENAQRRVVFLGHISSGELPEMFLST